MMQAQVAIPTSPQKAQCKKTGRLLALIEAIEKHDQYQHKEALLQYTPSLEL
jgi:hypothetical protein